jgi:hypothetical protein
MGEEIPESYNKITGETLSLGMCLETLTALEVETCLNQT